MAIIFNTILKTIGFFLSIFIIISLTFIVINFIRIDNFNSFSLIDGKKESENIIALLKLNGLIIEKNRNIPQITNFNTISPSDVKRDLEELKKKSPKVLIISINSPGGTVSASKNLYEIIKNFKENQEVEIIFHTDELLASGAYWTAISGDKIFANYGSIIGSIGVKGPDWIFYNEPISISNGIFGTSIESKQSIKVFSQTAGKSKDLFNPFREPSQGELLHLKKMVTEIYDDFVRVISKERSIEIDTIKNNIGALIYTTKNAKNFYLIDGIETLDTIVKKTINRIGVSDYKLIEKNYKKKSIIEELITSQTYILNNSNENENYNCLSLRTSMTVILSYHSVGC